MNEHQAIIAEIHRVFRRERPHSLRLSDAIRHDEWGIPSDREFEETWNDWTQIEDWQIDRCPYIFSYFNPEEIRYFVPAYMLWTLRDLNPNRQQSSSSSGVQLCEWLLAQKQMNGYSRVGFTPDEVEVVERFLGIASENEDYAAWLAKQNVFLDGEWGRGGSGK